MQAFRNSWAARLLSSHCYDMSFVIGWCSEGYWFNAHLEIPVQKQIILLIEMNLFIHII